MTIKNKHVLLSLLCIGVSVPAVLFLITISANSNFRKTAFNRKFISKMPTAIYYSDRINGLRSICGIRGNRIYFETDTAGNMVETDLTLSSIHRFSFDVPERNVVQSLYTTFIDSPYCYIMAGNVPGIIRINTAGKYFTHEVFQFPNHLFSESIITNDGNVILRTYQKSDGGLDQVLAKWNPITQTFFTKEHALEKHGDAGFATDGVLLYDANTRSILYVEYYSSRFICMDTLLNVLYKGTTIDSSSSPAIKVLAETSRYHKSITNASPLYEINLESKATDGKLFIHSTIRADNENNKEHADRAVIDIYKISDGQYTGSFYIPKYKKESLKDFEADGDRIIVLYQNYIAIYTNPFSL